MSTERNKVAILSDPELVAWIDAYREHYKFSKSDVLKLAVIEFRERHGGNSSQPDHAQKLADALRLYHAANDSIDPGILQRRGVADSYREAVELIKELEERGDIDSSRALNVVDMAGS